MPGKAEAQTRQTRRTAMEMDPEVVPVLNKIDLPAADPGTRGGKKLEDIAVGIDATDAVLVQRNRRWRAGNALSNVLCAIFRRRKAIRKARFAGGTTIDPRFDNYLGVVSLIRIKTAPRVRLDKVKVMSTGQTYNADRLGIFTKQVDCTELKCGEVGWLVCAIKDIHWRSSRRYLNTGA